MNPEVKQKWVDALRSGEYEQGKDWLKTKRGFCCLGVLTDIYLKETGVGEWTSVSPHDPVGISSYSWDDGIGWRFENVVLPNLVRDWAGLSNHMPLVDVEYGEPQPIATVNDSGTSFTEIADMIEEQF